MVTTSAEKRRGFTLIELLVVMAIISLLSAVIVASFESTRSKARDAQRKASLNQVRIALESYYLKNGTYQVVGSGSGGGGQGWLAYENGSSYATAVTRALHTQGYLTEPIVEDPRQKPGYMIYICAAGRQYSVSATLENPTPAETAYLLTTCNGASVNATYGKNYAISNI